MEYDINELKSLIKEGNADKIKVFMNEHDLELKNNRIVPKEKAIKSFKEKFNFWDMRQLARKILLNSLYGKLIATLLSNEYRIIPLIAGNPDR